MIECYYPRCLEKPNISWKCNYALRSCGLHYINHKKDLKKIFHEIVLIEELINECTKKGNTITKNLNDAKKSIINQK